MTLLVGQQGVGWTPVSANNGQQSGYAFYLHIGYVAQASGTMTAAHFNFFDTGGLASAVKISVYQGGNLIATSGTIAKASGDQSALISGNIVAGVTYILVAQPDTNEVNGVGNSGASIFNNNQNTPGNFPYASPPASLPAPDVVSQGQEVIMWIDGTAAPTVLAAQICL